MLGPYVAKRRRLVASAVAAVCVTAGVDLVVPLFVQRFIDEASAGAEIGSLVGLAGVS